MSRPTARASKSSPGGSPGNRTALLFYNEAKHAADGDSPIALVEKALDSLGLRPRRTPSGRMMGAGASAGLAVALGGDGTMLRAARAVAPHSIPLLGINAGGLGFLAATDVAECIESCRGFLEGRLAESPRRMLEVSAFRGGRRFFGPEPALNDCVIRAQDTRAVAVAASYGGAFLADYFGDGLIVSTPTGSTAYALAAQGPIVEPTLELFILAPICPHTLAERPLVLPMDKAVSLTLRPRLRPAGREPSRRVSLCLDGQVNVSLEDSDVVKVTRYPKSLRLLTDPRRSYFDVLRRKLKWGEESRLGVSSRFPDRSS